MNRLTESFFGFTLLEVMVSLAILSTAFAAVLKLHADSIEMMIASRIHTSAAQLAQYKMTELEIRGLENMGFLSGEFNELAPDYLWNISVEPTSLREWNKVTVTITNRLTRKGGEYHLTEYLFSGKGETEPVKPSTMTRPDRKDSSARKSQTR